LSYRHDGKLPEIVEYEGHPRLIGVQFHPEIAAVQTAPSVHVFGAGGDGAVKAGIVTT
jgi:CTP synthase (UTP-ammonia lyase)